MFFAFVLKVTHFPPPCAAAPNSSGRSKRPVRGPAMMAPTKAPTPPAALGLAGRANENAPDKVRTYCFATCEKFIHVPATEKQLPNHVEKALRNSQVNQNMINSDKPYLFFPCVLLPNERFHKIMGFRNFAAENRKFGTPKNLEFQPQNSSVLSPQ